MPTLSIVIPSHNRADLLGRCLATVVAHAPPGTEILVVDDASPSAVVSETAARFPGVRSLRLANQQGFCRAANAGIAAATAPFIELLNDDTEVAPGWAESPLRLLANPAIAAVAPLVLQWDASRGQSVIDSAGDDYDPGGFASRRYHGRAYLPPGPPAGPVAAASASAAFYRRNAILEVGGFPSHFGAYFEDVDLSLRLRRQGYQIHFDPASIVWHHISASYGRRPPRRILEQQSCNEERLYWRNARLRHLPRHLAVLLAKAGRRTLEANLAPWLTGRFRAWLGG